MKSDQVHLYGGFKPRKSDRNSRVNIVATALSASVSPEASRIHLHQRKSTLQFNRSFLDTNGSFGFHSRTNLSNMLGGRTSLPTISMNSSKHSFIYNESPSKKYVERLHRKLKQLDIEEGIIDLESGPKKNLDGRNTNTNFQGQEAELNLFKEAHRLNDESRSNIKLLRSIRGK